MMELPASAMKHHSHAVSSGQCSSMHVREIAAPLADVWLIVRRFDWPQLYKKFIRECCIHTGSNGPIGSIRKVKLVSGLPATMSIERLELLDDEQHVISFSIIGGDHRLVNYRSTMSLHEGAGGGTVVVESYVVDVPPGSTEEETRIFLGTIIGCNLQSLAHRVARP